MSEKEGEGLEDKVSRSLSLLRSKGKVACDSVFLPFSPDLSLFLSLSFSLSLSLLMLSLHALLMLSLS